MALLNKYSGSILMISWKKKVSYEEVSARAQKRLLALQIDDIMQASDLSKTGLGEKMSLESLDRLARVVGK